MVPTQGNIDAPKNVAYLPQDLGLDSHKTISDIFNITEILQAIKSIEKGDYQPQFLEIIDEKWNIAEQTVAVLSGFGFRPALEIEQGRSTDLLVRPPESLSGGEAVLVALCSLFSHQPDFILLDGPTNNLDSEAKEQLLKLINASSVPVVAASHDRWLLSHVETIAELHAGKIRFFHGDYATYADAINHEQAVIQREIRDAAAEKNITFTSVTFCRLTLLTANVEELDLLHHDENHAPRWETIKSIRTNLWK